MPAVGILVICRHFIVILFCDWVSSTKDGQFFVNYLKDAMTMICRWQLIPLFGYKHHNRKLDDYLFHRGSFLEHKLCNQILQLKHGTIEQVSWSNCSTLCDIHHFVKHLQMKVYSIGRNLDFKYICMNTLITI